FRLWAAECMQLASSARHEEREKAEAAREKLESMSVRPNLSAKDMSESALTLLRSVLSRDVLGVLGDIIDPIFRYFGGRPLASLQELVSKKVEPRIVSHFLGKNFGDTFNMAEMHPMSRFLALRDTLAGWQNEPVEWEVSASRLEDSAEPFARTCHMESGDPID